MHQPHIALVAGEASGDQLGAALIERLVERYPGARFTGIGGDRMRAAGMEIWWDAEELAVFGLFEVLAHFPRLLKLRRALYRRLLAQPPDLFVGIDAPDFNLGLEIGLRRSAIPTVHYVSPTIWAWRKNRVHKIGRAANLVLCLFPFEPAFYEGHKSVAAYVGHPLADQITENQDASAARVALALGPQRPVVAILPGSRVGEVTRLAAPMIEAARLLQTRADGLQFVAALANSRVREVFREAMNHSGFDHIQCVDGRPREVIAAADVVMCASGTATLETMLINRPMVVAYRLAPATYHLAKGLRLLHSQFFALPNILAGAPLVPELIQQEANAARLAKEVTAWLDDAERRAVVKARFRKLHQRLRCDASSRAADAVADLLESHAAPRVTDSAG
ncbi:MAG: lipid-A-disaccharide synthase [Xanthomonadales bacterium]|nr:lipid-A-disaccharide synthase [Xanthomonadales bacterium]